MTRLLELGADPDYVMPRGAPGRDLVPTQGQVRILSSGAQFTSYAALQAGPLYPVKNTEVGNGATALHAAVENGHLAAARALLVGGARQLDSMEGATPLVIALQYRHPSIAMLLLEPGWPDPRLEARYPCRDV